MRLGGELLHRKNPVSHIALCLIFLVVPKCGGVTVCEFQDANLLFPNTPNSSASDIRAKTWNKENGIRLASWMEKSNFVPNNLYGDRLMAIGENSIKIRNATRSDNGSYTLVLTSGSTQNFIEFTLHLEVLVPPTIQCIPNITREGNTLRAVLPPDVCGIPMLTPKWIHKNDNINVLHFESGLVPGMYTACAVGKSIHCFKEDVFKLCLNYTALQPQNESSPVPVGTILAITITIIIVIVLGVIGLFWTVNRRKVYRSTKQKAVWYIPYETDEENKLLGEETSAKGSTDTKTILQNQNEENALIEEETLAKGVQDIKRHLISQYKTMTAVALSPCYEESFVDISAVYCDLEFISLGVKDEKGIAYTNPRVASCNEILCGDDKDMATADNVIPIPAVILGECGSGKSIWCKNLVHQWCQYHDNNEVNLKGNDLSVPVVAKFDILLYIMLQNKLEGSSFMEYVKNTLFFSATGYFEYIISCISQHTASILILIDSFDEVTCGLEPSLNLLNENELFQCSVVVTSRSSDLKSLQLKALRIFQIQGMSPDIRKEYAKKVLHILGERHIEKLDVDHFWKFAKNIQVLSMCHIPLLCLSLMLFWIESKALSVDLTDVLLTIIEYYLRRAMTREKYKVNICQILDQQNFDISIFTAKTKHKQYLRDHGYLLKVISSVAEKLWYLQMQISADKDSAENKPDTKDNGNDVELCVETGILKKTYREEMESKGTHITFSHPLLFDFFVALSIALEKRDLCTKYMTTTKAVINNSYMIHMLCQVAPNIGQEIIKGISKLPLFDENNEKNMLPDQQLICNIECNDPLLQGGAPVKWLKTLMYTGELSSAKLSILTEGLKFTKELTVFLLQLHENRNECIFRLPILPKLQALLVDIENCTLLLHEEREWNKENLSDLGKFVLKSVKIDVRTTGYIVEVLGTCQDLLTLELCPKDDSDTQIPAVGDQKAFLSWGCLAKGITCMTKLSIVRLHNLTIGNHFSALIDSLCNCPTLETLDLMNLKEMDTEEIPKINTSDGRVCECIHQEVKQLEQSKSSIKCPKIPKTVQFTKNAMAEKTWLTLSKQLENLFPSILHIDQVDKSGLVLNELLHGISRCKNLNILSICCIHAGNDPVEFSGLRALNKLEKLTLCKIIIPDSSWKKLFKTIGKLTKLKEISLAHLDVKSCFIKLHKLSKLKLLQMREIELEEVLWTKLGNEIISLPKLKTFQLISCKMLMERSFYFLDAMKLSSLHTEETRATNIRESGMVSIDMVVRSEKKK